MGMPTHSPVAFFPAGIVTDAWPTGSIPRLHSLTDPSLTPSPIGRYLTNLRQAHDITSHQLRR